MRPLPDDFQMPEGFSGMGPFNWNGGMRAAFAAAMQGTTTINCRKMMCDERKCGIPSSGERARVWFMEPVSYGGVLQPFRWRRCQADRVCGS